MTATFGRSTRPPTLSYAEQLRRERVTRAARQALGGDDAARNFLETHHAGLHGRPLDLAVASHAGMTAVEAVIYAEGRRRRPSF